MEEENKDENKLEELKRKIEEVKRENERVRLEKLDRWRYNVRKKKDGEKLEEEKKKTRLDLKKTLEEKMEDDALVHGCS